MKKIIVNLVPKYPIYIGRRLLVSEHIVNLCKKKANFVVIIIDQKLRTLYGKPMLSWLKKNHLNVHLLSFVGGEKNKDRQHKEILEDKMFKLGCGRDTCIIAIGGGVTTDIAGFIASTYCRGIPIIYVPTSLLAMVDASIGGKTGVDTSYGKNLIGTFYQPLAVFIDVDVLKTLPKKEFNNGLVELIKHAIIKDKDLFYYLINNVIQIKQGSTAALMKAISYSCLIKKSIIENDERDIGKRQLLNFGHTIGHGLEQASNYKLSHGQAVAWGIVVESYMAFKLGILSKASFEEIKTIFKIFKIRLSNLAKKCDKQAVRKALLLDKKNVNKVPRFVLIKSIGSVYQDSVEYTAVISNENILEALDIIC